MISNNDAERLAQNLIRQARIEVGDDSRPYSQIALGLGLLATGEQTEVEPLQSEEDKV
jgi:hypothetical protein